MTDRDLGRECKRALERALTVILKAQAKAGQGRGGWRYRADGNEADVSVTGWQLLALRAAKNLGCDVPADRIDQAVEYLLRCREPMGNGFCYMPGGAATVPCTGTAVLCLEICGKAGAAENRQAGSYLLKHPLDWKGEHFFYGVYYGAQATFQLGNNYWNAYRPKLHKVLFDHQEADGSWIGGDKQGPAYATAMAVLALTVEYRLLPIYQRADDQGRGK
jgi:hypothetical protein